MAVGEQDDIIAALQAEWVWVPGWDDCSQKNTVGKLVRFSRTFKLDSLPTSAIVYCSADTRYKLFVNGRRVAVGPARSSTCMWYYDTLDLRPYLVRGHNELVCIVLRYFAASRAAMPFERTALPGLTMVGAVLTDTETVQIRTSQGWRAQIEDTISFPSGLVEDVFLHINERVAPQPSEPFVEPVPYNIKLLNGELSVWRLRPRSIPMPEYSQIRVDTVRHCESLFTAEQWSTHLDSRTPLILPPNSSHVLELQAETHSTAFTRWSFKAAEQSCISIKVTYSEGYESEPHSYPFSRSKADRLCRTGQTLIGPCDEVQLDLPREETICYEPFWFRTFRIMRVEIGVGDAPVQLMPLEVTQVNYPLDVKARWKQRPSEHSDKIWEVSVRTLRNCMFDGYSDCPFYEQLQYSGDSRSVGLFHYLLSGDDRLMRQTIGQFAASITHEGLTQSRFPSHVRQIVAGFSLYWILQVCDHHLFFGDSRFARSFLPRIDGVLEFFNSHIDSLGLVSGLPNEVWQYVDWVTTWGATETHQDKGVPTSGRASNRHTYFSMLYAYVLQQAARLVRDVGRPAHAEEYETRATSLVAAVRKECYDGQFFTDATADIADDLAYSQHCQVFAVLAGAASPQDRARILKDSFANARFSKCSYMMLFYAFRAFAIAGDDAYNGFWATAWDPWKKMLSNNLATWEEDDVRQRSDCHAWGSVPIYEYCTELAGIKPIEPGCAKILVQPRLQLSDSIEASVALGRDNMATLVWATGKAGEKEIHLHLDRAVAVVSKLPGGELQDHGVVDDLRLIHRP